MISYDILAQRKDKVMKCKNVISAYMNRDNQTKKKTYENDTIKLTKPDRFTGSKLHLRWL